MGHDKARGGKHAVYRGDPETFTFAWVADLGGDMHTDIMGCYTAYDHDAKALYVAVAHNDTSTGKPVSVFNAVDIRTGAARALDSALLMASMAYDGKTRRVYGTTVALKGEGRATSTADERLAALWAGSAKEAPLAGSVDYVRSLAYFPTARPAQLTTVSVVGTNVGSWGNLHTFDGEARVLHLLLSGHVDIATFVHTSYCEASHEPCPKGASCCCDPLKKDAPEGGCGPAGAADGYGICYAVDECSKVRDSDDPFSVPVSVVSVALEGGKQLAKVPVCAALPSNATVDAACPWSIEVVP